MSEVAKKSKSPKDEVEVEAKPVTAPKQKNAVKKQKKPLTPVGHDRDFHIPEGKQSRPSVRASELAALEKERERPSVDRPSTESGFEFVPSSDGEDTHDERHAKHHGEEGDSGGEERVKPPKINKDKKRSDSWASDGDDTLDHSMSSVSPRLHGGHEIDSGGEERV